MVESAFEIRREREGKGDKQKDGKKNEGENEP